jgi:hypothetical protein
MALTTAVPYCGKIPGTGNADRRLSDYFSEFAQSFDAPLGPIAGYQRAVDAAD